MSDEIDQDLQGTKSHHLPYGASISKKHGIGRREQKKRNTRARLIQSARELFLSKGYEATSVDEIAKAAGVSRRTCFRYFPTKESLCFPYREQRLKRFHELLDSGPPYESPYEATKRACITMAAEFMSHKDELVALETIARSNPSTRAREREYDSAWEQVIAHAVGKEPPLSPLQARLVAGAMMGAIRAILDMWTDSAGEINLVEMGHNAFTMLDRGVLPLLSAPAKS